MPTRIQIAKRDIVALFDESEQRIYRPAEIAAILAQNRVDWRLAQSFTRDDFARFLIESTKMKQVQLKSEHYTDEMRYVWGEAGPYEIALSIRKNAYLTHGTAVFLHALNEQIPAAIYVNHEQSPKPRGGTLSQESVNRAFKSPQRQSNFVFTYDVHKLVVINGKNTGRLEVGRLRGPDNEALDVTKIERTLIDVTVRPSYAGGIFQVIEAFKGAKEKMSVNTLLATLKRLDYVYPYHQAIGFYMERAGYEESRISRLASIPKPVDFYAGYGLKDTDYCARWRLFYPRGL
jgi:predicted transcriptional regulator of viral defense system